MKCDTCKSTEHDLDHCPYKSTLIGCCLKYYECYWCDVLFCQHGYLLGAKKVTVIPMFKLCPKCQDESDEH